MFINRGMVIEIEGNDGSGKRTTAEIIASSLEAAGFDVEIVSFPQHGTINGQLVDEFLYNGLNFSGDKMVKALREGSIYAVDRMVALTKVKENGKSYIDELNEGKVLIMDRYVASNFIHRSRTMDEKELEEYINIMETIEYDVHRIPEPDFVFVLKVLPEVSRQNIKKRNRQEDENESLENLKLSYEKLTKLIDLKGYIGIECCENDKDDNTVMRDKYDIAKDILLSIVMREKTVLKELQNRIIGYENNDENK